MFRSTLNSNKKNYKCNFGEFFNFTAILTIFYNFCLHLRLYNLIYKIKVTKRSSEQSSKIL